MSPLDIAVTVLVSAAFVAALGFIIYRRLKGKGGCDCGCSGCPHSCACRGACDGDKKGACNSDVGQDKA